MNNINILVEAKKEYTTQLQKILTPRLYEGFKSIYEDIIRMLSKELEDTNKQSSSLIKMFQKMLKDIPSWNQEIINKEYVRIEKLSNCDYFENLIEAVFITNTKILTSVQINDVNSINLKIKVPQPSHFIHKCYIECSKEIYKNPYIFDQSKNLTPKERHNNLREILNIIDNCINNSVRDLLPIGDILKQGLTKNNKKIKEEEEDDGEEEEDDGEEEEDDGEEEEDDGEEEEEEEDEEAEEEEEDDGEDADDLEEAEKATAKVSDEKVIDTKMKDTNDIKEIILTEMNDSPKEIILTEMNDSPKEIILTEMNDSPKEIILTLPEKSKIEEPIIQKEIEYETKEIIYNKVVPSFVKKLKSIEKIDEKEKETSENFFYKKENISNEVNNPFIKNIKNKIFIKTKGGFSNKKTSFYKKKYEENSANYNSVSDSLKETSKNKIMLDENSSDEETSKINL
jgi:hypothetical protein